MSELAESRAKYVAATQKAASVEIDLKSEEQKMATLVKQKSEIEESIAKGTKFLEQCNSAGRELAQANEILHRLEQQFNFTKEFEENAVNLSSLEGQIAASESEIKRLERDCETLRAVVSAVEQAIMSDKAYSLSVNLTDGTPCPVCGSIHHPKPAQPAHFTPSTADLDKCKNDADECAKKLENKRTNYASLNTQRDILRQSAEQLMQKSGGSFDKSSAQIKIEFDETKKRVDQLKELSDKTDRAQNKLNFLNNKLTANVHDIENANININNFKIQLATARQTLDSLTDRLKARGIGSFDELDKRLGQMRADIDSADRAIRELNDAHYATGGINCRERQPHGGSQ